MRIAIYHNLPSGGAKRTLLESAKRLAARHELDVYTLSCAEHEFADLRPWVTRHYVVPFVPRPLLRSPFGRLNQILRCGDLRRLGQVARRVAAQIDRGSYDVALVHPCQFEQSPGVLRYLRRTPSLYYCHEPLRLLYETMPARPYDDAAIRRRRLLNALDPLPALYRRMLRETDRANMRAAGTVLVNSCFTAGCVERIYGVTPHVSYHGVEVERFRPLPVAKRHVVLTVGSLTPLKGFDFLIRAVARYSGRETPTLAIASNFQNPQERAYIENLARDLKVPLVLRGAISDDDLVRLYNEATVVAYAPVREPFGLVALEAMACGTPVVAVDEGGVPESVVDRRTGFIVKRDELAFADAVRVLLDDQDLARRFGANGRSHVVNQWSWERAVASLENELAHSAAERRSLSSRAAGLVGNVASS